MQKQKYQGENFIHKQNTANKTQLKTNHNNKTKETIFCVTIYQTHNLQQPKSSHSIFLTNIKVTHYEKKC
jgi:hypothetical protein